MKTFARLLLAALLAAALVAPAQAQPVTTLLNAITTTGAGTQFTWKNYPTSSFQCVEAGTGTVTATVNVEVSQDGVTWFQLAVFTLSGTAAASSTTTAVPSYPYVRGNVTAITGTNAAVTLTMFPP